MVTAEAAPDDADWFCTLEQQWHLGACMETSYDTIPWWLRDKVDRIEYYVAYQRIARGLMRPQASPFHDARHYYALHARRADRGPPDDEHALRQMVSALAPWCSSWAVVSDDPRTASKLRAVLRAQNCTVAPAEHTVPRDGGQAGADGHARLIGDFKTLVGASAVVCSVRGGWSAFPYAATRVSGAPLVFTEALERSMAWRLIRAHSSVPVTGIHHGPVGVGAFLRQE
jgi:hypothetical protein